MRIYCILSAVALALLSLIILPLEMLSMLFGALIIAGGSNATIAPSPEGLFWRIWGNDEDPIPPRWYRQSADVWFRTFAWYLRNSHHNLQWHVIGIHGLPFTRTGDHPTQIWNPDGGWNFAVIRYGRLFLPFVSYRGEKVEWYIGWRESGAFGRALRKAHAK